MPRYLFRAAKQSEETGWRRQLPLPGRPDFAFPKAKVAVFTDGCFWHGCPRCYTRPKSNRKFWDTKVIRNRERDREVSRGLRRKGWRVVRIWEHALQKRGAARSLRSGSTASAALATPAKQTEFQLFCTGDFLLPSQ